MKLPGSTKSKITKNENGENFQNLEITNKILNSISTLLFFQ